MTLNVRWRFIDTPQALDEACETLRSRSVLGVDTEFMRETTFYPIPALIQLGDLDEVFLIDPCAVGPTPALRALLGREGPLKVLHACGEDLDVFVRWLGEVPRPIVDTQLAHALLGGEASMGYQRLIAHWCHADIPKDETRSNWLLRPLSEEQCRYAALDVAWLPGVWRMMRQRLEQMGRLDWLISDCTRLVEATQAVRDDELWYLRHRNAWRLNARQLAVLQRLCAWREGEVRRRDIPRSRLASDAQLFAVAEAMPRNRHDLASVEGIRPPMIKHHGDTLLAAVRDALASDEQMLPRVLPSPVSPGYKKRMKALKRVVSEHAEQLALAPEMLARRRELEQWVMADTGPEQPSTMTMGAWRGALLDDALRQALAGERIGSYAGSHS